MRISRWFLVALYGTVALMIVLPLSEALLSVWPLRPGDPQWRFGAAGIFSRAFMTPLLALVLTAVLGYVLEQRRVVLGVALLALLGTIALVVMDALFVLDALQMRAQVRPGVRTAFDFAASLAFLKIAAASIVTFALFMGAWRGARRPHAGRKQRASAALVGRERAASIETEAANDVIQPS